MQPVSSTRMVRGLESIIDAVAGILAEQSLDSTLQAMASALHDIVPFSSLVVYEVDPGREAIMPVFATGLWVAETLADAPRIDNSITGKVIQRGQMVHLEPGHPWFGRIYHDDAESDLEAIVFCPLVVGGEVIGTLNVWRESAAPGYTGRPPGFAPEEAQLIKRFATLAGLAYDNARHRDLLTEQVRTDELTGLYNRRYFYEKLAAELAADEHRETPIGLVLLDVDNFKRVNDVHGHPAGDQVLRAFASVLSDNAGHENVVCRTGGEEFAVILTASGTHDAERVAERLVAQVRAKAWGEIGAVTASAGLVVARRGETNVTDLFSAADERLLAAKAQGKDRVVRQLH